MFNNEQAYFCLQLVSLKPPPKLSKQPESSNSWKVLHTALWCTTEVCVLFKLYQKKVFLL